MVSRRIYRPLTAIVMAALFSTVVPCGNAGADDSANKAGNTRRIANRNSQPGEIKARFAARQIASVRQQIPASGDETDVYFPAVNAGKNRVRGNRFPLVIFLQGALVDKKYYSRFAQELASHGFVVAVPNHPRSSFGGDLYTEMQVIIDVLEHERAENDRTDSPLYGIIDTNRVGLGGHSFGAATGLFAIANFCTFPFCEPDTGFVLPTEIKAAALVAGNSGTLDLDTSSVPTALLIGELDTGLAATRATYETLELPRALIEVRDANHFGLNDIDQPPGSQERPGEASQTTPQSITATNFAYWSGVFLRAHLLRERRAWKAVYGSEGDETAAVEGIAPQWRAFAESPRP